MNALKLQPQLAQTLTFSPRLQHAVRLLQMSTTDYEQELEATVLQNPFLELTEPTGAAAHDTEGVAETPGPADAGERHEAELDWVAGLDRMTDGPRASGDRMAQDDDYDALEGIPLPASLRAHLHQQLGVLRLSRRERAFAQALVESLDDDGYLRVTLDDVARTLGETGTAAREELRTALRRVQALDPAGVAARDVGECLALQLAARERTPLCVLARRIVAQHLDLLAGQRYQRLATALQSDLSTVLAAVECIRTLDARPGARFCDDTARAVVPDAVVRKVNGVWRTALNGAVRPRVQLHRSYAALFEQHRSAGDTALKACLDQARWTLQNASQRMSTILGIATAIVAKQTLFLEHGHLAMKPLGLREIADTVGVHPSTVSRAVHQKYLATPHGVIELHRFFSRGMEHAGGGASAPVALQTLVRELIASEPVHAPWSDAELTRELCQQGFKIARRTVTKYRQGLGIAAVDRRRSGMLTPAPDALQAAHRS